MKKTILIAACLFSLVTTIKAQEIPSPKTIPAKGKNLEKQETPVKADEQKAEQGKDLMHKGGHGKGGEHKMPAAEVRAQKSVDHLAKKITLTEDQKPKIYNMSLERVQKMDAIREKYKGTPENKETAKTEIEAVRKNYREQVKGILTPEQLTALKEKRKAEKGKGMGKGKGAEKGKGKGIDKQKGSEKPKSAEVEAEDDLIDAGE